MSVSKKIRALMTLGGKKSGDLAEYLHVSYQAVSSKFYRESFSLADAIKIADFIGCELAFTMKDGQKIQLTLEDIQENE